MTFYLRSLAHDFTFRFDVLDVEKLEAALDRLVKIGDWGQLGARLRLNVRDSFPPGSACVAKMVTFH